MAKITHQHDINAPIAYGCFIINISCNCSIIVFFLNLIGVLYYYPLLARRYCVQIRLFVLSCALQERHQSYGQPLLFLQLRVLGALVNLKYFCHVRMQMTKVSEKLCSKFFREMYLTIQLAQVTTLSCSRLGRDTVASTRSNHNYHCYVETSRCAKRASTAFPQPNKMNKGTYPTAPMPVLKQLRHRKY